MLSTQSWQTCASPQKNFPSSSLDSRAKLTLFMQIQKGSHRNPSRPEQVALLWVLVDLTGQKHSSDALTLSEASHRQAEPQESPLLRVGPPQPHPSTVGCFPR